MTNKQLISYQASVFLSVKVAHMQMTSKRLLFPNFPAPSLHAAWPFPGQRMLALPLHGKTFLGSQQGGKNPSSGKVSLSMRTALCGTHRSTTGKKTPLLPAQAFLQKCRGREKPSERVAMRRECTMDSCLLLVAHDVLESCRDLGEHRPEH